MTTRIEFGSVEAAACDALVAIGFEQPGGLLAGLTGELYESKEFSGKALDFALLHRPRGFEARRLLLVGGGQPGTFDLAALRKAARGSPFPLAPEIGIRHPVFTAPRKAGPYRLWEPESSARTTAIWDSRSGEREY